MIVSHHIGQHRSRAFMWFDGEHSMVSLRDPNLLESENRQKISKLLTLLCVGVPFVSLCICVYVYMWVCVCVCYAIYGCSRGCYISLKRISSAQICRVQQHWTLLLLFHSFESRRDVTIRIVCAGQSPTIRFSFISLCWLAHPFNSGSESSLCCS